MGYIELPLVETPNKQGMEDENQAIEHPGLSFSPISRIISTTPMASIIPATVPKWSRF